MKKIKILVVDDEPDLCEILRFNLESENYEVDTANSAKEALSLLSPEHDLILLDVMMSGMSGFQMVTIVRNELKSQVPIILLTAKNTENDLLTGFNIGGDDYITKPFSLKEVLARVKAVLKRSSLKMQENTPLELLKFENLEIDFVAKTVKISGVSILFTKKEFLIFTLLIQNPNRFYSREEILKIVWKDDVYVVERSVDVHITRMRKKLGPYGDKIINRTGFGYCFKS